jgi:hypothetical protein
LAAIFHDAKILILGPNYPEHLRKSAFWVMTQIPSDAAKILKNTQKYSIEILKILKIRIRNMTKCEKIRSHPEYSRLVSYFLDTSPQYKYLAKAIARETSTTPDDVRNSLRADHGKRGRPRAARCPKCGALRLQPLKAEEP